MTNFSRINNITGWLIFFVSALLYLLTMESTVSLWDCGEFISAAGKLEVGHPPGAPFYLMLARVFSLFAFEKDTAAICINALSALASAFTVLFLFWTITHLARKIVSGENTISRGKAALIISSGATGALAFAFSDTFWISATEAEVYALSSLFTALVFWCILKWEDDQGKYAHRWLVLIAYLMGLSIGIHLLNLLAIPAIGMVVYFRYRNPTFGGTIIALLFSFLLLGMVLYLFIPGTVRVAAAFEIFSVNSLHFPVNSGLVIFIVVVIYSLLFIAWKAHRKGRSVVNIFLLCFSVMLIGYTSYSMIVIRAMANPPLNTGNPSDVFSLLAYLNRDQYGDRPLLYGQYYNAPVLKVKENAGTFSPQNGEYKEAPSRRSVVYDNRFMTFFPRMYSSNPNHIEVYKSWGTIKGKPVEVERNGKTEIVLKPNFLDNLEFFFKYQVGYMYLRYFLWNFAGKQNDMQGNGGILKGNWISGFDILDRWMIGPQNELPGYLKKNKGKNRYFLLPLLLGIAGLVFHLKRNRRYGFVVGLLFLLTGLAIVVYTNQTPLQPRERDYVYVGSFYAFSIWIGIGVLWLFNLWHRKFNFKRSAIIAVLISFTIPAIMFVQNFDDHNRGGRKIVRDIAYNYLNSCEKNAILFTTGDNDTYPLWYLQEVEGIRTDVRVVNLMLLNAPWYIDQMKQKTNHSEPLPVSLKTHQYRYGKRNWVNVGRGTEPISIQEAIGIITDDSLDNSRGSAVPEIPSGIIRLSNISDSVIMHLPGSYLSKNEIIVMDIIARLNPTRPVYFNSPGQRGIIGLDKNLQLQGYTYKVIPELSDIENGWFGKIKTQEQYDLLMNKLHWSTWKENPCYLDDHIRNMLAIMKVRQNFARLSLALSAEMDYTRAQEVADRVMQIMPVDVVPYDHYCVLIAEAYYRAGAWEKGDEIVKGYLAQLHEELDFFKKLSPWMKGWVSTERSNALYYEEKLKKMLKDFKRDIN